MAANGNGYVIPFGIDAKDFFTGLKQIDAGVDEIAASTTAATTEMSKGFEKSASAGDKLEKTLASNVNQASTLSKQAGQMGKDLGNALNGKNVGNDLKTKLDSFTAAYGKFTSAAGKKLAFNIDTAKLKQFEQMLIDGQDELKVLAQVSAFAKAQLKDLAPDSAEFKALNDQIEIADEFLKGLGSTTEDVTQKQKSLKAQLRELKAALADMELAGQSGTAEFREMSLAAGALEDQIGDVSSRVRVLASDTKYIDAGVQAVTALAGGFAAAQGAIAIFGSENEALNKTIQKVTGAMALLQGIQAIANALNKDSALSVLFLSRAQGQNAVATTAAATATTAEAGATVAATVATRSWTAALLLNPIFLLAAVLIATVGAINAYINSTNEAGESVDDLKKSIDKQNEGLALTNDLIDKQIERRKILNRGQFAGNEEAKKAADYDTDYNGILQKKNQLAQKQSENQKKINDGLILYNKLIAISNKVPGGLEDAIAEQGQKVRLLQDQNNALLKQEVDLGSELTNLRQNQIADRLEKDAENRKKAIEKAQEDAKKRLELEKQAAEQRLKFIRELENATLAEMADGFGKERALVEQQFKEKIQDLEREKSLSKQASETRKKLIKQLKENEAKQLADIDKKEATEAATLQFESQKIQTDLMKEGLDKELAQITANFTERRRAVSEQFKNDQAERFKLIRLLNAAEQAEKDKVRKEAALKDLKAEEENQILQIETASKFLGDLPKVEEQKQIDILKVKLKYATKAKELLIAQGNAENSTVVLQAEKTIQELDKALKGALENRQGKETFSMFDFLGLGDLTEEQKNAVIDAAKQSLDSIRQITDFIVEQYQRQIDKKQEVIDQIDDDISELETKLDEEKNLREQGFANNVDLIEKEIEEKQRQKEEEIKQQEELQRKQRAIAKAQLILDTAMQASNLITSATQIFKVLSGIPIIGIPLAIATIALMTGAFVTAKVKAFQAVGDQQSFGEGGEIDGPSHDNRGGGGVEYVATNGSGAVRRLEGKEWVTKKSQAQKYKPLLRAINDDTLGGMSDAELGGLLAGLGIHFDNQKGKEAIDYVHQRNVEQNIMLMQPGNDIEQLESINANVAYLAGAKKDETQHWEDKTHYYQKNGNTITKTPKQ